MDKWNLNWNNSNSKGKWGIDWSLGQTTEQKVVEQKKELSSQGLPISVRKDKATPTGVGSIVRGVGILGADVLANVRNAGRIATGQEEKPVFKSNYLGDIKGLGKINFNESMLSKNNINTVVKSAATGAEIASWLAGGGEAKAVTKGLTKTVELASKKTFAEIVSKQMPSWLKLGAGIGTSQTLGTQGREYADIGKPFDWKQAVKDISMATILTPVAELGIRKLFGTNAEKIIKARQVIKDAEIASNKVRIEAMSAGQPSAKFMSENGRMLPSPKETPIIETKTPITETPKVEQPTQPQVDTNSPEFKQKVKESYDTLNEANPEEFNAKTHEVYANKFALDYMSDPAKVERIALGIEQHPEGAAFSDAYNALLSNEASKTGNIDLIEKLSNSSVSSISGQKLEANKLRLKDNVVDVIKKVKQGKFNELPNAVKKVFTKEESSGKKFINSEMTTYKPTKEVIGQLIDSLICK